MLIDFLKNNLFVQNLASFVHNIIPSVVEHNWQKYTALKKAFHLTALDDVRGDYLEFGIFTGSSFVHAIRISRKLRYMSTAKTSFYGFDSFAGFGKVSDHDKHPFYLNNTFTVNKENVIANIYKHTQGENVKIIDGYFEETIQNKKAESLGITKSRIVFIDCDLKDPAALALEFVKPTLQKGTILMMDDFFSYKGDQTKGVAGAFNEFNQRNPDIKWRKVCDYGYGGVVVILS